MSEPDWIGPASDCLKEHFSQEAAAYLRAVPGRVGALVLDVADLLVALEALLRPSLRGRAEPTANLRAIEMIARYRGETPEATLARLSPPNTAGLLHQAGYFTPAQMERLDDFLAMPAREPVVMTETTETTEAVPPPAHSPIDWGAHLRPGAVRPAGVPPTP